MWQIFTAISCRFWIYETFENQKDREIFEGHHDICLPGTHLQKRTTNKHHTSYTRGRYGSSNMANIFTAIPHRLEFYEIFDNEVYLSPNIHLDIQILADI